MGLGSGRGLQEGEDIGIPLADSCGCMAETNTNIVKQLSFNKNKYILLKKESSLQCKVHSFETWLGN